ncbi:MAG: hypothetical protein ABIF09_19315, partial [Gemmatimonadota bacterium]
GSVFGVGRCAFGRAGAGKRSGAPALVEVIVGNGLRVGGIELWGLVEVVGEPFLGDLFLFPNAEFHGELGRFET